MKTFILILVALALTACGLLSPAQQQTGLAALNQMLADGTITQVQYDSLVEALLSTGSAQFWQGLAATVVTTAIGMAGTYIGTKRSTLNAVREERGPVATPVERTIRAAEIVTPDQVAAMKTISTTPAAGLA